MARGRRGIGSTGGLRAECATGVLVEYASGRIWTLLLLLLVRFRPEAKISRLLQAKSSTGYRTYRLGRLLVAPVDPTIESYHADMAIPFRSMWVKPYNPLQSDFGLLSPKAIYAATKIR